MINAKFRLHIACPVQRDLQRQRPKNLIIRLKDGLERKKERKERKRWNLIRIERKRNLQQGT